VRDAGATEGNEGSPFPTTIWKWVCGVALVSSIASLVVFLGYAPDFFMGDDFELIGDALAGVSPLEPVAGHLRPIIRLHFALYRWIPSAEFFGALSVLLHALACGALLLALRETHGPRIALPAVLLFFGSFLANEAIFWASSAAVLYCMIFCGLSLACFVRGRLWASYASLVLAALSYELWAVIPILFLFHFRRARELFFPFGLVVGYYTLHLAVFGVEGASAYGGFSVAELPLRFSIYAYRFLSPLAGLPSVIASLTLALLILSSLAVRRFRFAGVLYAASALVFALSAHVPSRFYYFPSLALILAVATGLQSSRRGARVVAAMLAVYLAAISPWINVLDGEDYRRKAALHEELFDAFSSRVEQLGLGDAAVIVNRLGPERLNSLAAESLGRPKLLYVRGPALAGMIYPDDAVRMTLWPRAERPAVSSCTGRAIDVGRDGLIRSTYCFRVASR